MSTFDVIIPVHFAILVLNFSFYLILRMAVQPKAAPQIWLRVPLKWHSRIIKKDFSEEDMMRDMILQVSIPCIRRGKS